MPQHGTVGEAMLEGFWVRNFKSLKQVGIGTCFPKFVYVEDDTNVLPYALGPVTLFTGANGTGKSSAVDAVNFVSDCYRYGADAAVLKRGGYDAIYSQGSSGLISFGFQYRQPNETEAVTYAVSIDCSKHKVPYIETEILAYQRGKESLPVMFLQNSAKSIRYLAPDEKVTNAELTKIEFTDYNHLGLAALDSHPKFPVLQSLRLFFENWTLCHFTPDPARGLDKALPHRQESPHGVSLSGVVRYIIKRYKNNLRALLKRVAEAMPNIEQIFLDDSDPSKPQLSFQLSDRDVPVPITHISAGTVRLFTYFILLQETEPAPLVVFEEPENGLDRQLRTRMLEEISLFAGRETGTQILVNTHHPAVVNAMPPSQVWVFEKDRDGFTAVERASDSIMFESESDYSDPEWFSIHFDVKR
ncbi:MAG: AAA family ATPase [Planctomycetaceae bacterium]|jgi:predicted ATPase|nr:AAA family ATPase [Planctomycetaceae bacterium]